MILGAIESNPAFALDDTDLRENATGYTADLLPKLHDKYPDSRFTFIIGADSLASANWVRLDEVVESLERFAIAPRAGVRADALARVIDALRRRCASVSRRSTFRRSPNRHLWFARSCPKAAASGI